MCMYSATEGLPNQWHMVHLGSRAVGGAALVMAEATAVVPNGRICAGDTGIWNVDQASAWAPITQFIKDQGSVPAIQIAHAGRKAGSNPPWLGNTVKPDLGWDVVGPSAIPFNDFYGPPREMTISDVAQTVLAFQDAARRAVEAGFEVVEIHAAHGYLLNAFWSPLSNQRTDQYGGSFGNRTRIVREIATAIRGVIPEGMPLFIRFSATDWVEGGWDLEQSIQLAKELKQLGVDLVDCSSGGNSADAQIPIGPGFQVPLAQAIREQAEIATAAVGLITEAKQAEEIVAAGKADMVFFARESLRDPYFPRRFAAALGCEIGAPKQYRRAWEG